MKKMIRYGILILIIAAIAIYRYAYQEHRDIQNEKAVYVGTMTSLEQEFIANDSLALKKFQNQTIELTVQLSAVDTQNKALVLDKNLYATFNENLPKNIIPGKTLKIKGRFLGYDELLEEFKMDQCTIVNP
ncbi:hypothetical protein [Flavobacterium flavipallidum]|uniref:tRNA_anti-like n=1 Tax=Flavobacterium flavipallidum TaxID=3139140 RepID=A0ABU9HIG9_9FLAO